MLTKDQVAQFRERGFVVAKGQEIGIDAPANAGLAEAVRRVERGLAEPSLGLVQGIA